MTRSDEARQSQVRARRRARLAMSTDLSWLRGFPIEGGAAWTHVPVVGALVRVVPDRSQVTQSFRTLTALTRRYRRLLAEIVDDPILWERQVRCALEHMQRLVHDGTPLPRSAIDDLGIGTQTRTLAERVARDDGLGWFVDDLTWIHLTDPRPFRSDVNLVRHHSSALRLIDPNKRETAHRTFSITRRLGSVPSHLVRLFGIADHAVMTDPDTLQHHVEAIRKVRNGKQQALPPRLEFQRTSDLIDEYVRLLHLHDGDLASMAGIGDALLAPSTAVAAPDVVARAAALYERTYELASEFVGVHPMRQDRSRREQVASATRELESTAEIFRSEPPVAHSVGRLMGCCKTSADFKQAATVLLHQCPTEPPTLRLRFLRHLLKRFGGAIRLYPGVIESYVDHAQAGHVDWIAVVVGGGQWDFLEDELARVALPRRGIALDAIGLAGSLRIAESAILLVGAGVDDPAWATAVATAEEEGEHSVWAPDQLIRRVSLAIDDPHRFVAAAVAFNRAPQKADWNRLLDDVDQRWHLPFGELLALPASEAVSTTLIDLARSPALLPQLEAPPASADALPTWAGRYPDAFTSLLQRLTVLSDDAEAIAEGVLGHSFPDRTNLERQIAAIEERLLAGAPSTSNNV